ncbi:MAG: Maf family protein [Lawsonibacter sp.]|jgi:septum formation protein
MAIILASQSPRRRELLEQIGLSGFQIRPAHGEESPHPELSPDQLVEELSRQKALEVGRTVQPGDLVIAADTVVAVANQVLGKPHSTQQAKEMLSTLSGRSHTVYTGITILQDGRILTQHEATRVRFRPLTAQEISCYVATGEPMDKAGAYGIQGYGALFVEAIEGDYSNVVGLPVCRLGQMLAEFGLDVLAQCAQKEQKT